MSKIPAINEIDANSPSQESTEVVVKATTVTPDINEIQETISASATIQEIDGTRKPTISEIYKIINDGLFESTTNWWDYAYKLSQAQLNQDIISRLDNGVIGGGYSKGVDIITTTSNKIPSNTNVYSALKSDALYPKKLNDEVINGIYDFLNGITIGKPTAYTGGTWSVDQIGRTHLTTDYLYVRLKAIFETLQILNVDTIGGKLVISPAGSITIVYVDNIKVTIDDNEQNVYRCYFLGEQEGEEIENKWKVGDQAQAKSFNVKKGTYHKTGNHYLWRLVVGASTDTVTIDGKKYHYVDLSQLVFDTGSDAPAPGDVLNQLGHRGDDLQRQTAIVLNAVDNYAPSITLYAGINDFTLLNKEYVEYGVYQGKAFFNVYGDMYIGDKGSNPTTYIKYKNGKIDIKANLAIGSSIDGKDLDKYIKENGGVDEKTVISLINNSQVIKDLQNQADGAIETWFYEGEPTLKNLPAVDWTTNELKKIHTGDLYYDQNTGFAYRFTRYNDDVNPYAWNRIKDNDIVKALEAANKAQVTADSKMKIFYGEAKPTNYQAGDMWVNATLAGKFNNDIARSTTTSKTFDANHWVLASRYSEAIQSLLNWSNQYTTKFEDLTKIVKEQKDQSISNWFYDYEPTDSNAPANLWNTEELRKEHIGDIFYDTKNNHSYRWTGSAWSMIKDADFDEAMKKAKEAADLAGDANDLADKKRQIFYSNTTPTGGDRGDLWIKQVGTKTEVWVFDGTNWVKSNDKALADYSEAINIELQGIKGQLDGKAETWYQADDPSTNWTNKTSHEGDIWYNTTNGTTQYWNGKAWEKMDIPKDVFDTIDSKSSIFVDSYDDAKAGKGIISNGYNERDIWILPADAIVNGVQYYKGDILTAIADDTVFNEKHWTKKVRYVGDKELTTAIDKVNKKINDISATTLPGLDDKFNEFAKDGVIDSSEKARLTDLLNQANNDVLAVNDQITSIIKSDYLTNDNVNKGKLIEAQKTLSTAWNEYKTLINTLIASEDSITKNNIAEASSKYTNLQNSIKAVKQYLAACQADMLSNIGIDINSYKYLKEAFKGKTEVNGGLVVTNVLQLRQTSDASSPITAGISGLQGKANANGVVDKDTYDITSIAAWFGGPMVDKDIFTTEQLDNKVAGTDYARSLFRHDGSGYLASGAIYWGTDGILHGNPNSFILQGTSIATIFYYTRLFYLHYATQDSTDFNNIDYITPKKTFSRLSVLPLGGIEASNNLPTGLFIGDSKTGGSFQIGNIILRTKSGDPNILEIVSADSKKTAHLGVQGGVSAYGTYTPSTVGGGGLNGTIIPYSTAIASDPQNEGTKIASASSIYKLHSRISNIETNGATNISVSGSGNAITSVSKNGNSIAFTKGATFLTSHQSLANYYTKSSVDSLLSGKSATSHTHSVKINGVTKTIAASGGTAVDLGTYLTSHQSLANYVTIHDSRLTDSRYPKFDNKTWYLVGDDAYIGDHNIGGTFCIKSANDDIVAGIALYNKAENKYARLWFDNKNINLDHQLVMNNNRIWIQGVGTAGGNNNRLTLVSGMPSGLAFNTLCRGTILYSNGIAFADPYNGNSNSDSGWIRHLETTNNVGTLEIAVGDDNLNEEIHFRWYDTSSTSEHIGNDITVPRATGTLALTSQIPTTLPANGGNSDTVDGYHASGLLTALSNSDKGISITVGGTTKSVSNISVNYASSAGNADTVDDEHASAFTRIVGRHSIYTSGTEPYNYIYLFRIACSSGYSTIDCEIDFRTRYHSAKIEIRITTAEHPYNNGGSSISITKKVVSGRTCDFWVLPTVQSSNYNYYDVYYKSGAWNSGSYGIISKGSNGTLVFEHKGTNLTSLPDNVTPVSNNVATSATKLQTPRTIWGQSFDGTANVNGTIYINNSDSENGAIILNNNINANARISAIKNQVIFNTGGEIRFGETSWDWNKWAGLKYTHSNKTIYLGIADESVFTANSAQSNGTLKFPGITTITPDGGARIGGSGGDLYLGNANNSNWVKVQNICSHNGSNYWYIHQNGNAHFNNIDLTNATINGNATINDNLSVTGLINNKGILPTNYEVNNKGTSCYVSADALCSGITAITDSIQVNQVTVQYSNDSGNSWTNYSMNNDAKFNLYASNGGLNQVYLGCNVITGNNNAEKLAQIKKNELIVSFYISNSCYSQVYFASVDISNGISTICTVEYLNSNGVATNTFTKVMNGWNQINYINLSNGNEGFPVGNDNRRYIRFRFKHDQNTTALRNTSINKIRIFSFTKYSFPTDRIMGHTGHIYNFDYNMNTYFPNSILAKGGVTAYQSSDIRLKTNITKLNCLNVIKSIGGTYEFDYVRDHKHSIGFIAQNVNNPLLKDIVAKDDNGYLKINYWNPKLISLAFGALTEIDNEVDKLKARVRELENEVEYLKNKDYALQ